MHDDINLAARQKFYENIVDNEILKKSPIIIRVDGRSFSRLTRNLKRPYEPLFLEAMAEAMFFVISEIGGAVFGYQQSDEISFVIKNDSDEFWYGNRIQKLTSITSSLTTLGFYKALQKLDPKLNLIGESVFDARVIPVPSILECLNNLIWRQQDCIKNSITDASQALLTAKFGKKEALNILNKKTTNQKLELMKSECQIDFEEEYPPAYKYGVGAYKVPFIVSSKETGIETTRKKWVLDWELKNFLEDKEFIYNILLTGSDIVRGEHISSIYEE